MAEMNEQRIRAFIREVWENGQMDRLDQYVTSDTIRHSPPMPDINGRDALGQSIRDFHGAYSDVHFDVDEVVMQGDSVVTRGVLRARHTGTSPAFAIPATGKAINMAFTSTAHVRDGKIAEEWAHVDYLGVMQQLGAVPAAGGN